MIYCGFLRGIIWRFFLFFFFFISCLIEFISTHVVGLSVIYEFPFEWIEKKTLTMIHYSRIEFKLCFNHILVSPLNICVQVFISKQKSASQYIEPSFVPLDTFFIKFTQLRRGGLAPPMVCQLVLS